MWTVKGAIVNLEPGRAGLGFDHFHPSTTAELTFVFAVCFETGFVIKKMESLTYWLQVTQIKANAGYAASKMKCNEDPSSAGEDRRALRPLQTLRSLNGTSWGLSPREICSET